ncbi:hypothetical protein GE061_012659 [Apolygus lucorum]|uniref:THAP-type domain-containing protein n=1 Tax=Apolygus lucorum TaxID=248454 RepID=A0A8S9XV65_APOLU|nr:hypothetical protein GE061_012659 [Apolygus lucorum]
MIRRVKKQFKFMNNNKLITKYVEVVPRTINKNQRENEINKSSAGNFHENAGFLLLCITLLREMDKYVKCAVRTCSNNSKKSGNRIRYFRFPREDDLLTLWTVRCDRLDTWTPSTSFVCSSHFTADDYLEVTPGISRLHPEAVPSRNLGYDWDNDDRADVMMMEEDFTSDDDENNDSIARALMSMSERATSKTLPNTPLLNFPLTAGTFAPDNPSTSTELVPEQARLDKANDPNVIVITDITKKYKSLKQVPPQTPPKKKKHQKNLFCCVPTCSAFKGKDEDIRNGFHYFPREASEREKWVRAIFHNDLYIKNSRFICRRHFTTDDYRERPRSGTLPRLKKGAVPTQNIPICESEFLLARKKLWLDAFRRKPEDKNLTFVQQLSREPELQELLKRFVQDALKIDPSRAHVVPCIPRRGEKRGCGVPVQGTGIIPEKKKPKSKKTFEDLTEEEKAEYLAKKAKKEEEKKERLRLRELRKKLRRKQLSEERKMRLFEEKLERMELRKSNPQAYHELLAEERLMHRQEELSKKIASGKFKFPPNKSENLTMTSVELKSLKESDPEAYTRLLSDTSAKQRKERLAQKITDAAIIKNPVNFSDKIEIIANDPEKGGKYKIVVKKVFHRKRDMNKDYISQLAKNKKKSMEIVQNVIKEIDFTKAKRIKFAETEKLTKISKLRSMGIDVQGLGMIKNQPEKEAEPSSSEQPVVVEPMITGDDVAAGDDAPQDLVQDHQSVDDHFDDHFDDDHHSDNDPFGDINCSENFLDDMTDGYDHCYTNKTILPDEENRPKDPFDELKKQLEVLPEDLARALVKEKMDGYKETFKKQMTRMRALLQSKKKIDRKVKMLTRALCLSLREHIEEERFMRCFQESQNKTSRELIFIALIQFLLHLYINIKLFVIPNADQVLNL